MKYVLQIQTVTLGNEAAGDPSETWEKFADCWGAISPIGGKEYLHGQQVAATTTHRITTEFVRNVNSEMRLVVINQETNLPRRVFNVESVINVDEANRELEWMCEEVAADA